MQTYAQIIYQSRKDLEEINRAVMRSCAGSLFYLSSPSYFDQSNKEFDQDWVNMSYYERKRSLTPKDRHNMKSSLIRCIGLYGLLVGEYEKTTSFSKISCSSMNNPHYWTSIIANARRSPKNQTSLQQRKRKGKEELPATNS